MAVAYREVGETDVGSTTARVLLVIFLVAISSGILTGFGATSGRTLSTEKVEMPRTEGFDIFVANRRLLSGINRVSDRLEEESVVAKALRPGAQKILTMLGAGTEQVWQGRDAWLFFKPDVDHVIGPGFLDRHQLIRRAALGDTLTAPPHPDPRRAIVPFAEQLRARGISLIVVPTPVKPSVHPEKLAPGSIEWVANPSRELFLRDLSEAGILVFDPAPAMLEWKGLGETSLYLASDTHWRPETVEAVARELASFITERVDLPEVPPPGYQRGTAEVSNIGDTAALLDLDGYPRETVVVPAIRTSSGELWRPEPSADVLVLGDSFANVYSLGAMGWGESGGLVEHLSYALGRPIDRLTQNAGGAFASRQMLADELRRGRDRLGGKRLVIYQFAERELSQGDWKQIDLVGATAPTTTFLAPTSGDRMLVRGIVSDRAPAPRPGTVPYRDHIIALHLTDVEVEGRAVTGQEALVYMWSMRDNVLTPAATLQPGDTIRLRLSPWYEVSHELEQINRAELPDDAVRLAQPWWAEFAER